MCKINCQKELVNDDVWVACSGGVDSIVVAHYILHKLKRNVKLFHYNHNLREQNDHMEAAVSRFAGDFDLHLRVHTMRVPATGEAEMRHNRYLALQRQVGPGQCVTSHHLDDCVESYLMNCFNGVPEHCPIPIRTMFDKTQVIRPFLLTPKLAFQKYSTEYDLDKYVVEDDTNVDQKYRRNWVRHRARPMIEEEYPGLKKVVFKKMVEFYDVQS